MLRLVYDKIFCMGTTIDINMSSPTSRCRVRVLDSSVEFSVDGGKIVTLSDLALMDICKDIIAMNCDKVMEEYREARRNRVSRPKNSMRKDLRIFVNGTLVAGIDCFTSCSERANRMVSEFFYLLGLKMEQRKTVAKDEKVTRAELLADYDLCSTQFANEPEEFQSVAIRDNLDGLMDIFFRNRVLEQAKSSGELSPRQKEAIVRAEECLRRGEFAECYFAIWDYLADNNSNSRQYVVYDEELKAIRPLILGLRARVHSRILLKK